MKTARPLRTPGALAALVVLLAAVLVVGGNSASAAMDAQGSATDHAMKHTDPTYVCPMHPQVTSAEPGTCPICGMTLVAKAADATAAEGPSGEMPAMQMDAAMPAAHESAMSHAMQHGSPTYVCPMHPQVTGSEPGTCPICGMDLVLKSASAAPMPPSEPEAPLARSVTLTVSDAVLSQLGVRTAPVRRGTLTRHIQGSGVFLRNAARSSRSMPQSIMSGGTGAGDSHSAMMVLGQVFERDAPLLREGQAVQVRFPNLGAREWSGTVASLETQISQTTHTLQFRVLVDSEGAYVPGGMTAIVTVAVDPLANVLLVPRESVIVTGKGARVIVAAGEGRFQQRVVKTTDFGEDEIAILSGLREGEQVVVSAQFLLDSEASLQAGLMRLTGAEADAVAASEGADQ